MRVGVRNVGAEGGEGVGFGDLVCVADVFGDGGEEDAAF